MVAKKKAINRLINNLSKYLDNIQLEQVNKAYLYATNAHSGQFRSCLLYTSPSPRDSDSSRMPSSA